MNFRLPITSTYSGPPRSRNMSRSPRPTVCSGRMLAFALNGRSPTITVTDCTSQPSRSMTTLTMQLTGLAPPSTSRATLRAASRSFCTTSPERFVWMMSRRSPANSSGYFVRRSFPTSSASFVSFIITNKIGLRFNGLS